VRRQTYGYLPSRRASPLLDRYQIILLADRGTYKKGDIEALEKVQKRATKILSSLRHISYSDRLKVCKLTTLRYRQVRGDMIEVYKIVSGKYDSAITPTLIILDTHQTRGNDLRLQKSCLKYDMRTGRLISVDA